MAKKHPYTLLILNGGIPVSVWNDGTVDIHVPQLIDLETPFGISWHQELHSFNGKIVTERFLTEEINPKIGQTIRILNLETKICSLPIKIEAVYHNGNIAESVPLQKLYSDYPNQILGFTNFTNWGEFGAYTLILKKYIKMLADTSKDKDTNFVNSGNLISLLEGFVITTNPSPFIEDLVKARIIYFDNNKIRYNSVLVYLTMYQINCSFKMGGEPFPFSN